MFASHEVTLDTRYDVASGRLVHLLNWAALHSVSETAYEGGLQALVRVGPFGDTRGLSKLVRVRLLDPIRRDTTMTISLRWEATGLAGELFPMLDADFILTREGEDQSRLMLVGSYRPPFGRAGAAVDRAILSRVAEATFRSLLDQTAAALMEPAQQPQPAPDPAPRWLPVTKPSEP